MSLADVKQNYNSIEWKAREQYYITKTNDIVLVPSPSTRDIMRLTAQIDEILSEALLDYAYTKRMAADYHNKLSLSEKEAGYILKKQSLIPDASGKVNKLTTDDIKNMTVTYLKTHPIKNSDGSQSKFNIYDVCSTVDYRNTFMESVVKILSEKKSALISDNAMLKIEAGITNTPQNN